MSANSELIAQIETYLQGSTNPDFVAYREQTMHRDLSNPDRYIWSMRYISRLGGFSNKTLLDTGCGVGLQALTISLLGANRVVACNRVRSLIDATTECVRFAQARGVRCTVDPRLGDVCDLDLPSRSFDGVYSFKGIEHVRDVDRMLDRCVSLLKPGGTFVVLLNGNSLNAAVRRETSALWHNREQSWDFANTLRKLRPIEHADAAPFRSIRQAIVTSANPKLTSADVTALVDATAGMLKPEIEALAKAHCRGAALPVPGRDWCRDPITGEYTRRLFDPFDLAVRMRKRGLRARVHHAFRKFPLRLLNSVHSGPLSALLFRVRPLCVIVGEKGSDAGA